MIVVENLTKHYGKQIVIDHLSVTFHPGVIYGLVGANGCGKTTLIRCICGFTKSTEGKILVGGKQIGKDVDFAPRTGIIIEAPGFMPHYSGLRNLLLLADISGRASQQQARAVMQQVGLDPDEKKPVRTYSLGMRQRLGIAQAIMEDPSILMFDEPFNGLDKHAMNDIRKLLQDLKEQGKTIILISHYAAEIEGNCDTIFEMVDGKLTMQQPRDIKSAI